MKPRLPVASLTSEDLEVVYFKAFVMHEKHWPWSMVQQKQITESDRRDADLMLDLMLTRTRFVGRLLLRGRGRHAILAYQGRMQ